MHTLRKYLSWVFAFTSVVCLQIALSSILHTIHPSILHPVHRHYALLLFLLPHAIYNLGRRLRSGLVDRLEGKAIGEGLGNCRKPVLYSGFALANHFFLAIRLGRRRGRVD